MTPSGRHDKHMVRAIPVCGLSVLVLAGAACTVNIDHEGHIEREERRFPAASVLDLHLYTFDGVIEVRAWDRPEVLVEIEKRGQNPETVSEIQVVTEQTGNRIQVEARHSGSRGVFIGIGRFTSTSARFTVSVPRRTNVVARTGDGSILVQRVDGSLELRTGDGTIHAVETAGEMLAESGDGRIQLDEVSGRIEARTDDGSVRLTGTPSALRARSGDGSIVLRLRRGTVMAEDWMVSTDDGSISVELPDGFSATIEADPGSDGRARSDVELIDASGGTRETRVLRGRLGDGGHTLLLRTGDGTIRLTRY
jgi:hypothetical protein